MTAIAAGARAWLDHRLHTKELFTAKRHYTIIDAPGHRDSIKNRIKGASLADVALILVPADGNFTTAIARGSHKACETRGHMRQHLRPIKLLCVKQSRIGVNKMNYDSTGYGKDRYDENANKTSPNKAKADYSPIGLVHGGRSAYRQLFRPEQAIGGRRAPRTTLPAGIIPSGKNSLTSCLIASGSSRTIARGCRAAWSSTRAAEKSAPVLAAT